MIKKNQKKKNNVFIKIFLYTMLLVLLVGLSGVLLFSQQFLSFYRAEQQRMLDITYRPIITAIADRARTPEEIVALASEFADNNQSYRFIIKEEEYGEILFATDNLDNLPEAVQEAGLRLYFSTTSDSSQRNHDSVLNTRDLYLFDRVNYESTFVPGEIIPQGWVGIRNNNFSGVASLPEGIGVRDYVFIDDIHIERRITGNYFFTGYHLDSALIDYSDIISRSFIAISLMLVIAVLGAVLFAKMVTKPLENEIIQRKKMEENQRLFFSAASHELKTPIASARALVEGMIAGVGDYNNHHKYLRECLNTLDSQGRLVTEILDIVKLSDKETELSADSFDLAQLGNIVLEEYISMAEIKNIAIHGEFPKTFVETDCLLLQKVLSNIIANAVQNTPENGSIIIESEKNKSLHLRITNTGAQIPQEILSKAFEPFFRQDTARTGGIQSGLGLTIVKKALDKMQCPFVLENTSSGVVFRVELPLKQN